MKKKSHSFEPFLTSELYCKYFIFKSYIYENIENMCHFEAEL